MPGPSRAAPGFTLVEMLAVVLVLGLLAAISAPKISMALRAANEGATKGKLGSIRSAVQLYYADMEGAYPSDLDPFLQPGSKYLTNILPVYTHDHGSSNDVHVRDAPAEDDTGGWGYASAGADQGRVWVECTHTDARGTKWNQY